MNAQEELFPRNRKWASRMTAQDPLFFQRLTRQQNPRYLWIGCSDSRVPANEIVDLAPGELFVHRNIANVVVHTDLNCLSVLQYAIDVLQVEHIIVCGHYGCGGVQAVLDERRVGLADNWLRHVRDVQSRHSAQLDALGSVRARLERLCELNVVEQAVNVCQTTMVQQAWEAGRPLSVTGWVYSLEDGLLRDSRFCAASPAEVESTHAAAVRFNDHGVSGQRGSGI
jgi:carbonic anhydrase